MYAHTAKFDYYDGMSIDKLLSDLNEYDVVLAAVHDDDRKYASVLDQIAKGLKGKLVCAMFTSAYRTARFASALNRSAAVVLAYDEARIEPWWQSRKGDMSKIDKLSVRWIADTDLEKLADMAGRNMKFAATVQDGVVWLADDSHNIEIEVKTLMRRGEPVF